jgi:hypothetical protein
VQPGTKASAAHVASEHSVVRAIDGVAVPRRPVWAESEGALVRRQTGRHGPDARCDVEKGCIPADAEDIQED